MNFEVGKIFQNKLSRTYWTVVGFSSVNNKVTLKSPKTARANVFNVVTLDAEYVGQYFIPIAVQGKATT